MALRKFMDDIAHISKLGDVPGTDNGLTPDELRAEFDRAGLDIQKYINEVLIPDLESGEAAGVPEIIENSLDPSLTEEKKPAQAKAVGTGLARIAAAIDGGVRSGDYMVAYGDDLNAEKTGSLTVKVGSGRVMMQGNIVDFPGDSVTFDAGTIGVNRHDLVVMRGARNGGKLSFLLAVVKGLDTSGTPADPEYSREDLNSGENAVREFPLYRAVFDGNSIGGIEPLFLPMNTGGETQMHNITVPKAAFISDSTYPDTDVMFRANVEIPLVKGTMLPTVYFSGLDAASGILCGFADSYDGGIYLFATDAPEKDVLIETLVLKVGGEI